MYLGLNRIRHFCWDVLRAVAVVTVLGAALTPLRAHANGVPFGSADGGFESGFTGMTTTGGARIVTRLGVLTPPQGAKAALLGTAPDAGSEPSDATLATVVFPGVAIPTGASQLRFQAAFLTDEPTPSRTNDRLAVILRNQTTLAETTLRVLDTYHPYYPAPWTDYAEMTGWQGIVVDLSALTGSPDLFAVEFRLTDVGDGRRNSAALLDDVRLVASGLPVADAGFDVADIAVGGTLAVNGLGSSDDGTLVEYRWDFGDGTSASGPVGTHAYPRSGIFQGTLTVTDNDGNRDSDLFTVVVGGENHAPVITSEAVVEAVELRAYRYDVDASDAESTFGDTVRFSLDSAPAEMSIDAASGVISWRPTALTARRNPVTVRATDSRGLSTTQSFSVTVVEPTPFMVVTDDSGYVYVADSLGDGTWANWRYVGFVGGNPRAAAIADFTGDGALDFVTGSVYSGSTLTLLLFVNDGANNFRNAGPVLTLNNVSWPYGMAEGDFDRDGNTDIAISGESAYMALAFGNGRGGFTSRITNTGRGNGRGLDAADVDHDGDLDLVRGSTDGKLYLWRNDGNGVFTETTLIGSRRDPYAVVLGDFNSDGNPDVIAADADSGDPNFYAGRGDGTFATPTYVPSLDFNNYGSYDNYDFNGDGNDDIIAVTYTSRQVYYYAGNGDGTFRGAVRINTANTNSNCLGVAAPSGPPPAGAPLAVIDPNPAFGAPGANISFSAVRSVLPVGGAWWSPAWAKRQALLVNNQARPAQQDVQVRLQVPYATGMATDFSDLRFADQAGNPVDYWVESQTDGSEAFVWLRLPALAADSTSVFFLYYNSPGAVSESDSVAVFDEAGRSTGADGALDVTATDTTVNACTWLTTNLAAGTLSLPVANGSAFANGDTVLVIQMQNGTDGQVGFHEYATVAAGGGTNLLTLSAGLTYTYRSTLFDGAESQVAQVVRVPNYTSVTVRANASLTAPAWDGKCGGILVFFAGGTVTVEPNGLIHADARGFRGTDPRTSLYRYATGQQGESALGRGTQSFAANGSGGGGGQGRGSSGTDTAGGGGGGYGTTGGTAGGYSNGAGGVGGGSSGDLGLSTWLLGAGGGEGGADEDGGRPGNGGRGGGIVALRAARLVVDGAIRSSGANGGNASNDVGGGGCGMGGGGAGAGGSILLDVVVTGAGSLSATGGSGGGNNGCGGSGAGGGAGRIALSGSVLGVTSAPAASVPVLSLLAPQDVGATSDYAWDFGAGATASGMTAAHTFPNVEGDYPVRLTVTDPTGRSDSEVGLVRLRGDPPVANAGGPYTFDERYAVGGVWTVPLNGADSTDDSGKPLTYAWRLGNNLNESFNQLSPDGMPIPGLWTWSPGVSINGGAATIVGAGAWNNRYLGTVVQYPRVVGQSFRARILRTSGNEAMWGLKNTNNDFTYTQFYYAFYFVNSEIQIYESGSGRGRVAAFTNNVSYDVRIDVDYFGARYYLRQTGQPAWTLIYTSAHSADSPLRFGATVASGTHIFDDWTVTDSESALANPTVMYPRQGTYNASLTVTDSVLQEDTDSATITLVSGLPPTANPGGPYVIPESAANCNAWTLRFDGGLSSDPDSTLRTDGLSGIYRYAWDFGDGSSGTGQKPTHTYASNGAYTVTLTVWDQALQTASAQTTVTTQPGAPPVARPGAPYAVDEYAALAGLWTVSFDRADSSDDVGLCSYSWNFGDGSAFGTVAKPTHQYAAVGTYTVTLTVKDHALQEHWASTTVTVTANEPPVPNPAGPYLVDETYAHNGQWTYTFNGSGSTDDIAIWTYAWNFGDGGTETGATPTHVFARAGIFDATLTVTDNGRQARSATTQATVRGNGVPVADAGADITTEVGQPITLDASKSTDDFGIWTYDWDYDAPLNWDTGGGALEAGEVIIAGTWNWGDRYLVSTTATPRAPGASYTGRIGVAPNTSSERNVMWGLKDTSSNYSYTAFTYTIYFTNGRLRVYEQGSDRGDKGAYSEGRSYEARIDLKTAGATYYVRPVGTPTWTQLYDSTFADTSPLRLGVTVYSGVALCSDFRGPAGPLVLPPSLRHTDTSVEVVYSAPGTYHPTVTVTDHARQSNTATTVVTVLAGLPPVADNGGPYLTNEMLPTRLNGRSSRDDFGIRWYDWDFGDGQSQRTRNPWLDHVYQTAGTYLLTLTVTDYAGHTAVDTSSVNVSAAPVVACVPWQIQGGIEVPHDTLSGRQITLKGVCWSKTTPVTYTWDFGDGSATESGTATNLYKIEARHTYTGIEGTPFTARLTVTDADGRTATDTYPIRIRTPSIDVEINMAIDDGLWWLHGRQTRDTFTSGTYADTAIGYGYWTNANGYGEANYKISPTASALQGFHVNGHRETGDIRQDPYVETTGRGMRYITSAMRPIAIGMQTYGDPDTNRNTIGIETSLNSDQRVPYELGQAMDALVASGETGTYAITGTPLLLHRTYQGIVTDMVDAYAWGQSDGTAGGGWRYTWHQHPDNSAAQWGAIGLLAAEEVFSVKVPQWVKDRNNVWLTYSWDGTGFGYEGPGNGNCTTPSGMVQLAFVGANAIDDPNTAADDRDRRWATAENYIASQWNTSWWHPNSSHNNRFSYYAYYAFTKAMRVAKPHAVERLKSTGLDWFKDDTNGIARRLINRQLADGNWPKDNSGGSSNYVGDDLTTAWSVVMLSPTLFVQPPVADAGENRVWGLDVTLRLDGSRSYHLDPFRAIVRYEWDLDQDGIYDTSSTTDPTVQVTYTPPGLLINGSPGGSAGTTYPLDSLPRSLTVALRVTDNNATAISDVDTVTITLAIPPRPPIAAAGGPYQARVGVPITLNGGGSFDIDPSDSIMAWEWDTDGDRVYDDASGETVQVTFSSVGLFNLGLRVTDDAVMNDLNHDGVRDPEERLEGFDFTTVTVVTNSAPILNRSARLRFTGITEDTADPAGDTVEALLASDPAVPTPATDPDDDPIGIAVTGLTQPDKGIWQYKPGDSGDWLAFPDTLSAGSAVLLSAGSRIRFVPDLAYNNGQTASLEFQAWDHTSGSSGQTGVDVTIAGGETAFSLASDSVDLPVADLNDAPLITVGTDLRLTTITEDNTDPPGDTVRALLDSDPGSLHAISDPDFGAAEGIAVTGLTGTSTGVWQFRLAGATAWTPLEAVSASAATLLPADAGLRFLPAPAYNNGQTVRLAFRAWDLTAGTPGASSVDSTVNGGTNAFSTGTAEATLVVTPVNDAPVLNPAGNLVLTAITEDDTDPPGDTLAAILGSDLSLPTPSTDPDFGALSGIAITGLSDLDKGAWQYRLAGASSWTAFAPVSESAAVLLPTDARLRYLPLLSVNNGHSSTLTFRAWDQTSGTVGQSGGNTLANGGTTAFSTALETATLTVTDVNDAPVIESTVELTAPEIAAGNPDPPGADVESVLTSGAPTDGISDPDLGAVKGIAVTDFGTLSGGRWQFLLAGASAWLDVPAVSPTAALLLPPDAKLRFVPPSSLTDDRTLTVSFRAWDRSSGAAGTKADTGSNGGTSAFSAAAYTFKLTVRGGGDVAENWWYPSFSWEPILASGASTPYGWYHVQVFAAGNLAEPYFEANVHGTTMTAAEYFLAAFDGFPGGRWLWRYRPWVPALGDKGYGPFTPASLAGTPDPAYVLELDYGPAAVPTDLAITHLAPATPGLYLLSFRVGNARGYEVQIVRNGDGQVRTWSHAFIPGEDPDKQQGTLATHGLDNPPMDPPLIPRDELATLVVNLPEPGVYRASVRGFNPTDERDRLPPFTFTEFPAPITVTSRQPAYAPPHATGMIPGGSDLIAIPGSAELMPHRLQWDPLPGAQRFVLYLAAANASPLFNFEDVGSATRVDVALVPGSYTWQVVGLNDEGAVPPYGAWSAAQHFEVVRSLERPAMITRVERFSATQIRVTWAAGGAAPDLVSVRHFYSGQRAWINSAPRALEQVNLPACTGILEIASLDRAGSHRVLLRGYVHSPSGDLPGEWRVFTVPRLDLTGRRATRR